MLILVQQSCVRWALLKGASKIYAIDSVPSRLALAKRAGPNVIPVDFNVDNVSKRIHEEVPEGLDGGFYLASGFAKY